MGILKNSEYIAQAQARIADNATRDINEADVRLTFEDTANSYINRVDGLDIPNYNNTTLYDIGDNVIYSRAIYQKINQSAIGILPTDPTEWELKGSSVFAQQDRYGLSKPATQAVTEAGTDNFDYITPLRLAEELANNGMGGFVDSAVIYSNGGTPSGATNFIYSQNDSRVGIQMLTPNANLHVGNTQSNSIITQFSNSSGANSFTFYDNGHFVFRNQTSLFPDSLVDRVKMFAKDYNGVNGKSSPYFLTEDGIEINLREIKEEVDQLVTGTTSGGTADTNILYLTGTLGTPTGLVGVDQTIAIFTNSDNSDSLATAISTTQATLVAGTYIAYFKMKLSTPADFSVKLSVNGIPLPFSTAFSNIDATNTVIPFFSDGNEVLTMEATDLSGTSPTIESAYVVVTKIK